MEDNIHDVVKLLLARMESHPEEFEDAYLLADAGPSDYYRTGRWEAILRATFESASDDETKALNAGLRTIRMGQAHKVMMDELLNGEERRRAAEEKKLEEQKYYATMAQAQAQMSPYRNQSALLGALQTQASPPPQNTLLGSIKKGLGI